MEVDLNGHLSDMDLFTIKAKLFKEDIWFGNYSLRQCPSYLYEVWLHGYLASSIISERSFLKETNIQEILDWAKSMIGQNKDDERILTKYGYERLNLISYERKVNEDQKMVVTRLKDDLIRFHLLGGPRLLETSVFPFPHMEMAILYTERKHFKLENIAYMNQELRDGLLKNENTNQ